MLIETTGLADPAPIAQTFFMDPKLSLQFVLDGIITVVDAKHILQHLDEVKPDGMHVVCHSLPFCIDAHSTHTGVENESVEQVGFADRILLSKLDLVDAECEQAVRKRLAQINAAVEIIPVNKGVVDLAKILNIKAFDLDKILVRATVPSRSHAHRQLATRSLESRAGHGPAVPSRPGAPARPVRLQCRPDHRGAYPHLA